ncbi:MAG: MinD/ParA family protein [Gemmatimonadaceae bacterium]|nr:MinD/ParA family protein [Acetobacteraceae bacterium]
MNQTVRLRPSVARPGVMGRCVAVASGKGGVGKTWFAITLAHALARRGGRVLLFDGDLGLANIDIQLGLTPVLDLASVVSGAASLADAVAHVVPGGFDVLAGRSGSGSLAALEPAALDRLLDLLTAASERYDTVLLDLGAGLDRSVRRMSAWADTRLVVATEEPTSLTDAYATLKLHAADNPGGDARLVVNQASSPAAGERTAATLTRACTAFLGRTPALAGTIRRDQHVQDAIRRQTPLLTRHPNCPASQDVERMAATLMDGLP